MTGMKRLPVPGATGQQDEPDRVTVRFTIHGERTSKASFMSPINGHRLLTVWGPSRWEDHGKIFCVAEGGLTSPPDHWSLLIVSDLQGGCGLLRPQVAP
jgi:hypothetical protein